MLTLNVNVTFFNVNLNAPLTLAYPCHVQTSARMARARPAAEPPMGAKRQPPHAAGAPARTSGPLAGLPRQRAELGRGRVGGVRGALNLGLNAFKPKPVKKQLFKLKCPKPTLPVTPHHPMRRERDVRRGARCVHLL